MQFKTSFCDPLKRDIVDLGTFSGEQMIDQFKAVDWSYYLLSMQGKNSKEIFFSPSYSAENAENTASLTVSAIEKNADGQVLFYVFFGRRKKVKTLFGTRDKPKYTAEKLDVNLADATKYMQALQTNDLMFLEENTK